MEDLEGLLAEADQQGKSFLFSNSSIFSSFSLLGASVLGGVLDLSTLMEKMRVGLRLMCASLG